MKTLIRKHILSFLFAISLLLASSLQLPAQPPPDSDPSRGGTEQPVQEAPIGGGLLIMAGLGLAYGAGKVYAGRKRDEEIVETHGCASRSLRR
jgi:hypothetical protein